MEIPEESISLREFLLLQSDFGYGGEKAAPVKEQDGSTTIEYELGPWRFHDNYFTSEDGRVYFGRVVVFLAGKPHWYAVYEGIVEPAGEPGEVYGFLKKVLRMPDPDFPIRGPVKYEEEGSRMMYELDFSDRTRISAGNLDEFDFSEYVVGIGENEDDDITNLYQATFTGGRIN